MTPKVLVSNIMMLNERDRFDKELTRRGYEPVWPTVNQYLSEEECLSLAGSFDGWLAGDDQISEKVLQACLPRLKVISKWGTGVDSIDRVAAKALGVPVFNSPGAFGDAVGEYAIGLLLGVSRRICRTDRLVRNGEWPKGRYKSLYGKTIGIIGYGAIGQGVGERAHGLRMNVLAYDPFPGKDDGIGKLTDLNTLISQSDVICLCCNMTPDNRHMLNRDTLAQTKPGVIIVNVARGGLIDEDALAGALRSGQVGATAVDVFEQEPIAPDHPLLAFENVVVSSHNANSTIEAIESVHQNTLDNLYAALPAT
jgi:D-3-phosphoglycerate dehydrogenase